MKLNRFFKKETEDGQLTHSEAEEAQKMEKDPVQDMQDLIFYEEKEKFN